MTGKNRRYFMMGGFDSPSERAESLEKMREQMIEKSGLTPEQVAGAGRVLKAQHADREPTMQNGLASPARVGGEEYHLVESHVNAHGETVLSGFRKNGPQFEKIRITQEQAGPHTRIVTHIRGDR
jgi:hypothetical protein